MEGGYNRDSACHCYTVACLLSRRRVHSQAIKVARRSCSYLEVRYVLPGPYATSLHAFLEEQRLSNSLTSRRSP